MSQGADSGNTRMPDESDTDDLPEVSSPAFYEAHAAILALALAGPPQEHLIRQIRLERIEDRLAQFSQVLHQVGELDWYLCELVMQIFPSAGTHRADTLMHACPPLTPIPVADELIDDLNWLCGPKRAIDRQALRDDLQLALLCFQFDSLITSTIASKKRAQLLQQFRSNVTRAQNAIRDLSDLGVDLWKHGTAQGQTELIFMTELDVLTSLADSAKQALDRTPVQPRYKLEQPAAVKLLGINLPMIFEEHFGKRAGRGIDGPYMQFATTVIGAMGLKYKPNTIKAYLVAAQKKRN